MQALTKLQRLVLQGLPHLGAPPALSMHILSNLQPLSSLEHLELTTTATGQGMPVSCIQRLLSEASRCEHPYLSFVRLDPCAGTPYSLWQQLARDTHPLIRVRIHSLAFY